MMRYHLHSIVYKRNVKSIVAGDNVVIALIK